MITCREADWSMNSIVIVLVAQFNYYYDIIVVVEDKHKQAEHSYESWYHDFEVRFDMNGRSCFLIN